MRHFTYLSVILGIIAPTCLPAAPVPERKNAKPAVIDAGAEKNIEEILDRIPLTAPYPLRWGTGDGSLKIAIVRRHLKDGTPKDWKEFREWVKKNLRVERVPGKNHISISFLDGKPEEQAAIIKAVVDDYLKEFVENRRATSVKELKFVRDNLAADQRAGRLTPQLAKEYEAEQKKHEEYIRTLPSLVEHAKAR